MGYLCSRCGGVGGLFESSHLHSNTDSCIAELKSEKNKLILQNREQQEKLESLCDIIEEKEKELDQTNRLLREETDRCAHVADSEPWPEGPVPHVVLEASKGLSYEQIVEAAVKATRESIARKIRQQTKKRTDSSPKCAMCQKGEAMGSGLCKECADRVLCSHDPRKCPRCKQMDEERRNFGTEREI